MGALDAFMDGAKLIIFVKISEAVFNGLAQRFSKSGETLNEMFSNSVGGN